MPCAHVARFIMNSIYELCCSCWFTVFVDALMQNMYIYVYVYSYPLGQILAKTVAVYNYLVILKQQEICISLKHVHTLSPLTD